MRCTRLVIDVEYDSGKNDEIALLQRIVEENRDLKKCTRFEVDVQDDDRKNDKVDILKRIGRQSNAKLKQDNSIIYLLVLGDKLGVTTDDSSKH